MYPQKCKSKVIKKYFETTQSGIKANGFLFYFCSKIVNSDDRRDPLTVHKLLC